MENKSKLDVSTPARFEDSAKLFVGRYNPHDPALYQFQMIEILEDALRAAGFEKGVEILEEGYKETVKEWNKAHKRAKE